MGALLCWLGCHAYANGISRARRIVSVNDKGQDWQTHGVMGFLPCQRCGREQFAIWLNGKRVKVL